MGHKGASILGIWYAVVAAKKNIGNEHLDDLHEGQPNRPPVFEKSTNDNRQTSGVVWNSARFF